MRPRAELGRRRGALAARAARPAPRFPDGAAERARPAVGRRAVPRGARASTRSWRAAATPRTSPPLRGALRHGGAAAQLVRHRARRRGAPAIPERWGYATDGRGLLLTRRCRVPASVRGRSQVYYYRAMLEGLGLATEGPPDASLACPEEWTAEARRAAAAATDPGSASTPARSTAPRSAGCPSASPRPRTCWRAASGRRSRSSAARPSARSARRSRRSCRRRCACSAGETTLAGLVGVLKRLRLLLTNDSGPMHLAAAARHAARGRLRLDRLDRDGARRRPGRAGARGRRTARPACCASARSTTAA